MMSNVGGWGDNVIVGVSGDDCVESEVGMRVGMC